MNSENKRNVLQVNGHFTKWNVMQKCYNKKNVAYFNRATKTKQTKLAMMERRDTVEADFPGDFADSRSLSL